jgi:hypothetical protein
MNRKKTEDTFEKRMEGFTFTVPAISDDCLSFASLDTLSDRGMCQLEFFCALPATIEFELSELSDIPFPLTHGPDDDENTVDLETEIDSSKVQFLISQQKRCFDELLQESHDAQQPVTKKRRIVCDQ